MKLTLSPFILTPYCEGMQCFSTSQILLIEDCRLNKFAALP